MFSQIAARERIDSESLLKVSLEMAARLSTVKRLDSVAAVAHVSDGNHLSIASEFGDEQAEGVRYLRGQDISGDMVLDDRNQVFIPETEYDKLARSHIFQNDVLITIVGVNTGQTALVDEAPEKLTANCKLGILRPKKSIIHPAYLHACLAGRYGQTQVMAAKRGGGQMGLILPDLKALEIPRFSESFESKVAIISLRAHRTRRTVHQCFAEAESGLLQSLGLQNWEAPEPLSYVRSSQDAFAAGRLDAQYFHPAKIEALAKLSALSNCTVGDRFNSVRELWQPDDDSGPDVVRNYDLTDALSPFLDGLKEPSDRTTIASTKKVIRGGDLVVSRLRSYLKEIALVQPGGDVPMVASTEYIVLRPKQSGDVPVEALMIFLRSALPQVVFKWSQDGSNHPRFDENELLRLPLPQVLIQHSNDYVVAVRAVIAQQESAMQLLDTAKRAVEIAIEHDEKAAMAYLKANT